MSEFVRVGAVEDFPEGLGRIVSAARKPVAVFNVGGTLHAVNNICPHMGGPLGAGKLDGACVTCPYHGMRFDVTSGRSADGFGHAVQIYDVRVDERDVLVKVWWAKKKPT